MAMSTFAGGPMSRSRTARSTRSTRFQMRSPSPAPVAPTSTQTTVVAAPQVKHLQLQLRRISMEDDRIMSALKTALQKPPLPSGTVLVCSATEDEWNAFVDRDDLPIKANFLQWFAETSEIHIVELVIGHTHETFVFSLHEVFRSDAVVRQWLGGGGASVNAEGAANMPDLSFGPKPIVPGVQLPAATPWGNFKTIKVEIGVSQRWGMVAGQLDHKAVRVWAPMPGVQYVLCIKTNDHLTEAHYKLYDVLTNTPEVALAIAPPALEEIVQGVSVDFDARRVLGIPLGGPLPVGFPDPLVVDLFAALEEARTYRLPMLPPV